MKINLLFILSIFVSKLLFASNTVPEIIWASSPVMPDETLIIRAGNFSEDVSVEIAFLKPELVDKPFNHQIKIENWQETEIFQKTSSTLKCLIPADFSPGVFAFRLNDRGNHSKIKLLNAPQMWWSQGDAGESATPGGWLRMVGTCFSLNSYTNDSIHSKIYLKDVSGQIHPVKVEFADTYDTQIEIPADMPVGDYEAFVHNGAGGKFAWVNVGKISIVEPDPWPSDVFNVKELTLATALEQAKNNGGGIVYFPAGEYHISDSIEVPDRTILKGERMDLVSLYWLDFDSIPKTFVHGKKFGIKNLSMYCQNMYNTVVRIDDDEFKMDSVRIRANPMYRLGRTKYETPFRGRVLNGIIDRVDCAIRLEKLKKFSITNSDIYSGTIGIRVWFSSNGIIKDCRIQHGRNGIGNESTNRIILENCLVEGVDIAATGNFFATFWGNSGECYLAKNNRFKNAYGLDQELYTFDAAGGAYFGKIAEINGTNLKLASDPSFRRYAKEANNWVNAAVCIMRGKGEGQYRRVVQHNGRDWQVDQNWQVEPDENSIISIVPFRGNTLFIDNTFEDGGAFQLYGISINNIISGNKGERMQGFLSWGKEAKGWSWQPSWYNLFLNNEIIEGNNNLHHPAEFGVFGTVSKGLENAFDGALNSCIVFRHNSAKSNSIFRIKGMCADIVLEKNTIERSEIGVTIEERPYDILLRKNEFKNTGKPYDGEGISKSTIIE